MAFLGALGHLANLGQVVALGQGHAYQKEQVKLSQRNFKLDVQALKIDLLGAARDDVRGTYDTYIERLDTLLLLNALLLPFALNTLQFSDEFVPHSGATCPDCIEAVHPWLATIWVYLVAFSLVLPFWSLLLLLRCKSDLDNWLQQSLDELQNIRRSIIAHDVALVSSVPQRDNALSSEMVGAFDHVEIVSNMGRFIVDYQDLFAELWDSQCAPLVWYATQLLWCSAYLSVALVGLMFWLFLANRHGQQQSASTHFLWVIIVGLLAPVAACARGGCSRLRLLGSTARAAAAPLPRSQLATRQLAPANIPGPG